MGTELLEPPTPPKGFSLDDNLPPTPPVGFKIDNALPTPPAGFKLDAQDLPSPPSVPRSTLLDSSVSHTAGKPDLGMDANSRMDAPTKTGPASLASLSANAPPSTAANFAPPTNGGVVPLVPATRLETARRAYEDLTTKFPVSNPTPDEQRMLSANAQRIAQEPDNPSAYEAATQAHQNLRDLRNPATQLSQYTPENIPTGLVPTNTLGGAAVLKGATGLIRTVAQGAGLLDPETNKAYEEMVGAQEERNPVTSQIAETAGGFADPLAGQIFKGAGVAASPLGQGYAHAAATGVIGMQGIRNVEELAQGKNPTLQSGEEAATAGGLGAIFHGIHHGLNKLQEHLTKGAENATGLRENQGPVGEQGNAPIVGENVSRENLPVEAEEKPQTSKIEQQEGRRLAGATYSLDPSGFNSENAALAAAKKSSFSDGSPIDNPTTAAGSADFEGLVHSGVGGISHNNQILNSVIPLNPIDVMNTLRASKLTPQMILHDPSMLRERSPALMNLAVRAGLFDPLTFVGTKKGTEFFRTAPSDPEAFSALFTKSLNDAVGDSHSSIIPPTPQAMQPHQQASREVIPKPVASTVKPELPPGFVMDEPKVGKVVPAHDLPEVAKPVASAEQRPKNPQEMTRDDFIESHKDQFVKKNGSRNPYGVRTGYGPDGITTLGREDFKNGKLTKPPEQILGEMWDNLNPPKKPAPTPMSEEALAKRFTKNPDGTYNLKSVEEQKAAGLVFPNKTGPTEAEPVRTPEKQATGSVTESPKDAGAKITASGPGYKQGDVLESPDGGNRYVLKTGFTSKAKAQEAADVFKDSGAEVVVGGKINGRSGWDVLLPNVAEDRANQLRDASGIKTEQPASTKSGEMFGEGPQKKSYEAVKADYDAARSRYVDKTLKGKDRSAADREYEKALSQLNAAEEEKFGEGEARYSGLPIGITKDFKPMSIRDLYHRVRDFFSVDVLPKTRRANQEAADALAQHASAPMAAVPEARNLMAKILPDRFKDKDFSGKVQDLLNKNDILGGYDQRIEQAKEARAAGDDAGADKLQRMADDIAKAHDLTALDAEVKGGLDNPEIKAAFQKWKEVYGAESEAYYKRLKAIDPDADLEARGRYMGTRVNLKPISEDMAAGEVGAAGARSGNLRNPAVKRDKFDRMAKLTGKYDTDMEAVLANALGQRMNETTKLGAYEALQKAGLGSLRDPTEKGPKDFLPIQNADVPGEGGTRQKKTLWVRPDIAGEVRRVLDVDAKQTQNPVVTGIVKAQMTGIIDPVIHAQNLVSAIAQSQGGRGVLGDIAKKLPGVNVEEAIRAIASKHAEVVNDSPEVREAIANLAKNAMLRGEHPDSGAVSKMIHSLDTAARLVLNDRFDELVKRGLKKDTPQNRRDFVNQAGQYNRRLMGPVMQTMKDWGVAPFVVAGRNFNRQAVRALTGGSAGEAPNARAALQNRLTNVLGAVVGTAGVAATVNYLTSGKMQGRAGVPVGAIDTGQNDKDGKPVYVDLFQFNLVRRGLNTTGLGPVLKGLGSGESVQRIAENAANSALNAQLHPFEGPAVKFGAMALGGTNLQLPLKQQIPDVPGGGTIRKRFNQAVEDVNPVIAAGIRQAQNAVGMKQEDATRSGEKPDTIGQALGKQIKSIAGIKSGYDKGSEAMQLARELRFHPANFQGFSPEERKDMDFKQSLVDAWKGGDKKAANDALREKKINPTEFANVRKEAELPSLGYAIQSLSPDNAAKVYEAANKEEKGQMADILRDKILRSEKPYAEQDALLKSAGISPPANLATTRAVKDLRAELSQLRKDKGDVARIAALSAINSQIEKIQAAQKKGALDADSAGRIVRDLAGQK